MSVQTMEIMVKWVDKHVMENPTLKNMSEFVGYSPYYCSAKFHEYTGLTYKKYLAKCKINAAAKLLSTSAKRIIDIAFLCGYSSQESFARAFFEVYNCSPTQYRKGNYHEVNQLSDDASKRVN